MYPVFSRSIWNVHFQYKKIRNKYVIVVERKQWSLKSLIKTKEIKGIKNDRNSWLGKTLKLQTKYNILKNKIGIR